MGNSSKQVLEVADYITTDVDKDWHLERSEVVGSLG